MKSQKKKKKNHQIYLTFLTLILSSLKLGEHLINCRTQELWPNFPKSTERDSFCKQLRIKGGALDRTTSALKSYRANTMITISLEWNHYRRYSNEKTSSCLTSMKSESNRSTSSAGKLSRSFINVDLWSCFGLLTTLENTSPKSLKFLQFMKQFSAI